MAVVNVNGVSYTNYAADPKKMVDSSSWHGRVRAVYDSYTFSAAEADATSTVKMGRIPTGARFLSGYLMTDVVFGGTAAWKVEIGSTEVRAAAILNTVNTITWFGKNTGTELTTESDVTLTLSAASTPGTTPKLTCVILYLVD